MKQIAKPRNPSMDVIRTFAILFVVSVHFFANIKYNDVPVVGGSMYVMTLFRTFFMICVPLFLLLSGFLMCNKPVSLSHYGKLIRTLVIYALAGLLCHLFVTEIQGKEVAWRKFLVDLLRFRAAPYGWYVEMYIGLFLLCPFLNVLYHNLKNQKQKLLLVLTLFFITSLPTMTNIYHPALSWFLNPASESSYLKVLPDYWIMFYPVTYYIIGCYLREFPLKLNKWLHLGLMAATFVVNGSFNFYRSHGVNLILGLWQQYYGVFQVLMSVLFFTFFANLSYRRLPRWCATVLRYISEWSFGAYLLSWIFDQWFYPILRNAVPTVAGRFWYFPVMVGAVFLCSTLLSGLLNVIYNTVSRQGKRLIHFKKGGSQLERL
ncbi:MAG: acyltransferase family protein [Clostridia bacterium]|nr:acyltransferase family protein [Clostridia bacterium]